MSLEEQERRRGPRPAPFPPGLNLRVDAIVNPIVRGLPQPYRGLLWLSLLFVSSVVWVIWCLEVRMAPIKLHVDAVQQEIRLRDEVARLRTLGEPKRRAALAGKVDAAMRAILPHERALAQWLHDRAAAAREMGLRFNYRFVDAPYPGPAAATALVPIDIEIKINVQAAANNGYERLLSHLRILEADPWTKELKMAAMESEREQVSILKLTYHVWMQVDPENLDTPGGDSDLESIATEGAIDIASS